MKTFLKELPVETHHRIELVDVTQAVTKYVQESGVQAGLCLVFAVHSTTAIVVNEHESGLLTDIVLKTQEDFPREAGWLHDQVDENAAAHLAATFTGSSQVFPVRHQALVRGPWQNIFLLELDGPRRRTVLIGIR